MEARQHHKNENGGDVGNLSTNQLKAHTWRCPLITVRIIIIFLSHCGSLTAVKCQPALPNTLFVPHVKAGFVSQCEAGMRSGCDLATLGLCIISVMALIINWKILLTSQVWACSEMTETVNFQTRFPAQTMCCHDTTAPQLWAAHRLFLDGKVLVTFTAYRKAAGPRKPLPFATTEHAL